MEAVLTVRLDPAIKSQGSAVMERLGTTPSKAVRELFDFAVRNDALPFGDAHASSQEEIARRIAAFDRCHTKKPLSLTDDELRDERLRSRYGLDA